MSVFLVSAYSTAQITQPDQGCSNFVSLGVAPNWEQQTSWH